MMKLWLLAVVAICGAQAQTANYCSTTLCSTGKVHIACGNNGSFSSACAADKAIVSIAPHVSLILSKHNGYRNTVASGGLSGYLPALRMATMQWSAELANLAELNVKQCAMKHDSCRNTDTFKWSGQNLGWYWSSSTAVTAVTAITSGIDGWYNEYQYGTMAQINSYTSTNPTIGHFTPMVNDRNTYLGCALLGQSKNGGKEYFFACNYAQTNILNKKVYVSGTPAASQCTTGTNPSYPALCSVNEAINANLVL